MRISEKTMIFLEAAAASRHLQAATTITYSLWNCEHDDHDSMLRESRSNFQDTFLNEPSRRAGPCAWLRSLTTLRSFKLETTNVCLNSYESASIFTYRIQCSWRFLLSISRGYSLWYYSSIPCPYCAVLEALPKLTYVRVRAGRSLIKTSANLPNLVPCMHGSGCIKVAAIHSVSPIRHNIKVLPHCIWFIALIRGFARSYAVWAVGSAASWVL